MFDKTPPLSERVARLLKERNTWRILKRMAFRTTKDVTRAEDLVADTLERMLHPKADPWDGERSFLSHMSYELRHVYSDQIRLFSAREIPTDSMEIDAQTRSREPSPEEALALQRDRDRMKQHYDVLCEALRAEGPQWLRCLELMTGGADIEEQAKLLRWPVAEVYEAHRMIIRYGKRINEEWVAAEESRMRALRDRARANQEVRR